MGNHKYLITVIILLPIFLNTEWLLAKDSSLLKLEELLLKGDYIKLNYECNYLLTKSNLKDKDRVYHILAISLLKQSRFKEAREVLEKVKLEFQNSPILDDAEVSIADSYFLEGNFEEASLRYKNVLMNYPKTKNLCFVYLRLGESLKNMGNLEEAKYYFDLLRKGFPSSFECAQIPISKNAVDSFYTVQVGSFSKSTNARRLCDELLNKGYDAYITKMEDNQRTLYRVRVGHFQSRLEAEYQEDRLKKENYPTKICP
ncbi:MAG: tetratricopeptide repeat protein [Candidatus Omnitrophica bacterium]|nr:tetratricopeptide repeat protein [Candidatus Omnitrophota bacterium]